MAGEYGEGGAKMCEAPAFGPIFASVMVVSSAWGIEDYWVGR